MDDLVSIIIPAYNAASFIAETIDSVIQQSFQHWELIVVDDGSQDSTAEKVKAFAEDSRISYHFKKNEGVSIARNTGYSLSKGLFLAFLDADDIWKPQRLHKMLERFKEDGEIGLVHSYIQEINSQSQPLQKVHRGKEGFILDRLLLWDGCTIPNPSSILVKREVVEKVGGFSPELSTAADQEFFFRVAASFKIGMVKEILSFYRMHDDNMHKDIQHMEEDHCKAYQLAERNKLFSNQLFKRRCYANLYFILGNSWWVDGRNKWKGIKFWVRALSNNPFLIERFIKKLIQI